PKSYMSLQEILEKISTILNSGVDAVGFVSTSHVVPQILAIIDALHNKGLKPIIVYNTNGYEKPETIKQLDGIVYAVFISLGFAAIENILYVFQGGYSVGIVRAVTAVPAHALFGIMMGYNFGLARFNAEYRRLNLFAAFAIPFISHGAYDFLLMGNSQFLMLVFIPVYIFYWITGFRKMKKLSDDSAFRGISDNDHDPAGTSQL
ncbi:MAG: PrsW family intramembrane metalloprotease, partial [Bacteroidales bacterium]|nr:PrsW family intramembrane metalloprotease [Bacteroidales bacterium]